MNIPNFMKKYQLKDYKFHLIITVITLTILGMLVSGSAKEAVQNKQILGLILGIIAMVVISFLDYKWVLNLYWLLYFSNLGMLIFTYFFGTEVNGAKRWIDLKITNFQPSELTKIIMILFFAKYLMDHEEEINSPKTIITSVALLIPTLVLILTQPDLSTTISIAVVFCIIMYIGGLSYKFIATVLAILIPSAIIFISLAVQPDQKFLEPYQQKRILAWRYPEQYASDEAYQQLNSIMAIGSGQLTGKGLNNNTTTSVKNGNYILEPQTDFIFAIVGEELGFVGCCLVIGLLLLIVIQIIFIGIKAQNLSGRIICCGIASQIAVQSFINISVATGIFPNTGIPLPFVSYGLTSLVSMYMGIGFVLNVGLQQNKYQ